MTFRKLLDLGRDESGSPSVLLALCSPALLGAAAVVIDLGSLYLAERQLQGIADAAAAASVKADILVSGEAFAQAVVDRSGNERISMYEFTPGRYSRDPEVSFSERFSPDDSDANAARLTLRQEVPLFFASMLTGQAVSTVVASATAARSDLVAFDLGTKLLSLGNGLPNQLLSQLAGAQLNISDEDVVALASTKIDVLTFADRLRARQGTDDALFGEVFDQASSLVDVVSAMAAAADDPAAREVLGDIAINLGGGEVAMAALIDLGPLRNADVDDGLSGVEVDAYSLLRTTLEASHGDSYSITLDLSSQGLSSATVRLVGGYGYERSPWLSLTSAGEVVLRTAQTRLMIDSRTTATASSIGSIRVPLYAELASAEAQITDIVCDPQDPLNGVDVTVTPSLGTLALADVETTEFEDLTREPSLFDAAMIDTILLDVTGYSKTDLGGNESRIVHFSIDDVDRGLRKEVGTTDLAAASASSLSDDLALTVATGGLNIGLGKDAVTTAVTEALTQVAPTLDELVNAVAAAAGVKLGVAEVGISGLRCGKPALVG